MFHNMLQLQSQGCFDLKFCSPLERLTVVYTCRYELYIDCEINELYNHTKRIQCVLFNTLAYRSTRIIMTLSKNGYTVPQSI